eukprot:m.340393 g.340393  ORF g.340393 m.340393 type:complete len:319 (+) comp19268_c0_seq1:158-1114(+)
MSGQWCLIESDPGVLTEVISKLGVEGVQAEEVLDLSPEGLQEYAPVYGLIFLFKWQKSSSGRANCMSQPPEGMFFAKQTVTNACATQALLNILLNVEEVNIGDELSQFKEFTACFQPEDCGDAIGMSDTIRSVHNSFARQETFAMQREATEDDDAFHFVGFVPYKGNVYELDGLQNGPVNHGAHGDNWIEKAVEVLRKRIEEYSSTEIRFNLCALIRSRKDIYVEKLAEVQAADPVDAAKVAELEDKIKDEEAKAKRFSDENSRRKHNYIPLFLELLRSMAKSGKLQPAVDQAKEKYKEHVAAAVKERQKKLASQSMA